jgi:Mor family transcriptional regulator
MIELELKTSPIPYEIENGVINSIVTTAPEIYGKLPATVADEIAKKYNITPALVFSIRSAYVKNRMVKRHFKLEQKANKIFHDYKKGLSVLEISKKYDGSPLNIMRMVFRKKYPFYTFKEIAGQAGLLAPTEYVKSTSNTINTLSMKDTEQLKLAIDNDIFAIINNDQQLKKSMEFEENIEEFLKDNHIKYKTQEELVEIQTAKYGKPISTPDFLIETDLVINGKSVKWIDAKNFYGSSVPFVQQNIERQVEKYLKNYGSGALVFSLGYSSELDVGKDILLLGYDDLNMKDGKETSEQ